jgi:hypothetical protein
MAYPFVGATEKEGQSKKNEIEEEETKRSM